MADPENDVPSALTPTNDYIPYPPGEKSVAQYMAEDEAKLWKLAAEKGFADIKAQGDVISGEAVIAKIDTLFTEAQKRKTSYGPAEEKLNSIEIFVDKASKHYDPAVTRFFEAHADRKADFNAYVDTQHTVLWRMHSIRDELVHLGKYSADAAQEATMKLIGEVDKVYDKGGAGDEGFKQLNANQVLDAALKGAASQGATSTPMTDIPDASVRPEDHYPPAPKMPEDPEAQADAGARMSAMLAGAAATIQSTAQAVQNNVIAGVKGADKWLADNIDMAKYNSLIADEVKPELAIIMANKNLTSKEKADSIVKHSGSSIDERQFAIEMDESLTRADRAKANVALNKERAKEEADIRAGVRTDANTAVDAANTSIRAAGTSQDAAGTSVGAAGTAQNSAATAQISETNAGKSADAARKSETRAANSALRADNRANSAASSAGTATRRADEAAADAERSEEAREGSEAAQAAARKAESGSKKAEKGSQVAMGVATGAAAVATTAMDGAVKAAGDSKAASKISVAAQQTAQQNQQEAQKAENEAKAAALDATRKLNTFNSLSDEIPKTASILEQAHKELIAAQKKPVEFAGTFDSKLVAESGELREYSEFLNANVDAKTKRRDAETNQKTMNAQDGRYVGSYTGTTITKQYYVHELRKDKDGKPIQGCYDYVLKKDTADKDGMVYFPMVAHQATFNIDKGDTVVFDPKNFGKNHTLNINHAAADDRGTLLLMVSEGEKVAAVQEGNNVVLTLGDKTITMAGAKIEDILLAQRGEGGAIKSQVVPLQTMLAKQQAFNEEQVKQKDAEITARDGRFKEMAAQLLAGFDLNKDGIRTEDETERGMRALEERVNDRKMSAEELDAFKKFVEEQKKAGNPNDVTLPTSPNITANQKGGPSKTTPNI